MWGQISVAAIGTMSFENTITGDSREVEGLSASFRNDVGDGNIRGKNWD